MNKKIIALIVVIILLIIIGGLAYFVNQNRNETQNSDRAQENVSEEVQTENEVISSTINTEQQNSTEENVTTETGKTLVVYFSAQGHTKEVAQRIANNLGADIFELVPANEYTSDDLDWTDSNSRVTQEYEDESLRNIELVSSTVDNWKEYDTILIGYPIWWGIAAWPVDTFVKANDFNGKTVIPFCTSSSGLGESGTLLAEEANGGNWLEGHRFRSIYV